MFFARAGYNCLMPGVADESTSRLGVGDAHHSLLPLVAHISLSSSAEIHRGAPIEALGSPNSLECLRG